MSYINSGGVSKTGKEKETFAIVKKVIDGVR